MSVTGLEGVRVLRGPDWKGGDDDGGEGYLGTVTQLLGNHEVRVLWDMGQERTYSAGKDGVVELRVFDTAAVGIRHPGSRCAECGETDIYGMLWRCQDCADCDLCPLCYSDDKHELRHCFLRLDVPGDDGKPVPRRRTSVKVRAIGLHPGAKVIRGKDWEWGDQDGGEGSEGEVQGYDNKTAVDGTGCRNMLIVQWPHGGTQSYRLGVHGRVDLTCVEEEVGPFYYRDHLPLLDTNQASKLIGTKLESIERPETTEAEPGIKSSPKTSSPVCTGQLIPESTSASGGDVMVEAGKTTAAAEVQREEVKVGDRVVICVEEEKLRELQQNCGGVTARMLRCIGRTGQVTTISAKGQVGVKFAGSAKVSYRFNPLAVLKVTETFAENDVVRIRDDVTLLRVLNRRLGWPPAMDRTVNKVGRVVEVIWDQEGDLRVDFKGQQYVYAPACCLPAAGAALDSLTGGLGAHGDRQQTRSSDDSTLDADNMAMFRKVRNMVLGQSQRGDMSSLFKALEQESEHTIRSLCQQDPSMIEREHHDITPLIYTCLRGKRRSAVTLLDLGADVNRAASDSYQKTPMSAVLEGKSEEMAELLLQRGAKPDYRYSKRHTAAHLAAIRDKDVALTALVNHGADLNLQDDHKDTPLHLAIELKKHRALAVLVAAPQVNIHIGNKGDFDMIQLCCYENNPIALDKLLARDSSGVERLRQGHSTALHIAATNDNVECIRLLIINGGADIDARQPTSGMTALHLACHRAKLQTVEALLELGASVNVSDKDGDTPLHLAIGGKIEGYGKTEKAQLEVAYRVQICNMLISNGAWVDAENQKGRHPFMYGRPQVRDGVKAFMRNNRDVVRLKASSTTESLLQTLGVSEIKGKGQGQLKEALKGVGLPCGVCGAPKSDVTLIPCQHKCVCSACSVKITKCPLCDGEVKEKVNTGQDEKTVDPEACKQM